MKLIGADVGGTFTDLVLSDTETGETWTHKLPSTPDDSSRAVLEGVGQIVAMADTRLAQIDHFFHGTTVATNAALQHRGAKAGMITTRGFRDIIHIGRHQRPQHYSIQQEIPWQARPLVRRRYRKVVTERLAPPDGEVQIPLDEADVRRVAGELADAGVEAIAICFLFAYLNPVHERRAKALVQEICPNVFVTCSHEVAPQFREFERFTTTAMNAFIGPLVRNYVERLAGGLSREGFGGEFHIMRSNGGVAPARSIGELPVQTLMSGLAAGVLGCAWVGDQVDHRNIISLDIGGTSADIGVVIEGRFGEASARDTQIAGYPILAPMIDLHTIGAGGGSIAHRDAAGAFRVGPESAGADPGPVAYGNGGTAVTVTDANIVLGRLDTGNFLGGAMKLDADAARTALKQLAGELGMSVNEAAEGVVALLNANMANAIRARTVQKGIDPREFALVAAGGAGPLHAVEVARLLDIPEVIVPNHPGITSAQGLLTTDLKYDVVRTCFFVTGEVEAAAFNQVLGAIAEELRSTLRADHIDPETALFEYSADARYVGQGYELRLPIDDGKISDTDFETLVARFHDLHQREYGHHFAASPIEFVNLRATATVEVPKIAAPSHEGGAALEDAVVRTADTLFRDGVELKAHPTRFYLRDALPANAEIVGPAVILQTDSTTVLPPHSSARVAASGALLVQTDTRKNA